MLLITLICCFVEKYLKMKQIVVFSIFLLITVTNCQSTETAAEKADAKLPALPKPDDIKKLIEELRDNTKDKFNGVITLNGTENLLEKLNLTLDLDLKASGNITDVFDFDVEVKKLAILYTVKITFPKITVNISKYSVNGFIQLVPIVGDGRLEVLVKDFVVKATIKPKVVTQKKMVLKLTVDVEIESVTLEKFEITGWTHDEERSKILSQLVQENLEDVIMSYRAEIKQLLSQIATNAVKNIEIPI